MQLIESEAFLVVALVGATIGVLLVAILQAYRVPDLMKKVNDPIRLQETILGGVLLGVLISAVSQQLLLNYDWSRVHNWGWFFIKAGIVVACMAASGFLLFAWVTWKTRRTSAEGDVHDNTNTVAVAVGPWFLWWLMATPIVPVAPHCFWSKLLGQMGGFFWGQFGLEVGETIGLILGVLTLVMAMYCIRRFPKWWLVTTCVVLAISFGGLYWMLVTDGLQAVEVRQVKSDKTIGEALGLAVAPGGKVLRNPKKIDDLAQFLDQNGKEEFHFDWRSLSGSNCWVLSGDGRRLLSGGMDGCVILWDAPTGKQLLRCEGHRNMVSSLALSTDGRYALSGSADRTVRLWDLHTGQQLCICRGHDNLIGEVAFSTDGRSALSASLDGTVRVWQLPP
jgi:hypothetical protein